MNKKKQQKKLRKKWLKRMELLQSERLDVYQLNILQLRLVKQFQHYMLMQLVPERNERLLAVGCFNGELLATFDQRTQVKGYYVDQDPKYMNRAMHQYPHFSYELLTTPINFKSGKFSKIIISVPLSSFHDPINLLGEMKRLVKEEGFIYCYDTNETQLRNWLEVSGVKVADYKKYHRLNIFKVKL